MFKVSRIVSAKFKTNDINKLTDYYTRVIGMNFIEKSDNGNIYLSTGIDHNNIVLTQSTDTGLKEVFFEINTDYSLRELVNYFRKNNVVANLKSDSELGLNEVIEIIDPEGNIINILAENNKVATGFSNTGVIPNKLGHLAYNVKNIKKMVEFYQEKLHFKISDWMADFFCFMRCNSDHHTVNFIESQKSVNMNHVAFELKDMAHLQSSCDILYKNGKKILWGPVRHGIGHNISTYHYDDDGNMIELFCELDVMNEELGYFEPRPYHVDYPQYPKVWGDVDLASTLWGPKAPKDFLT